MRTRRRLLGLAAVACAGYLTMWVGWELRWSWLAGLDATALGAAHRIGVEHQGWVTFWTAWCTVLSPLGFRLVASVPIVVALVRRQPRIALFLFVTVELSGLVTEGAKRVAERPRPATALTHAASTSFPSGHALGAMVAMLTLLTVVWPLVGRIARPWLLVAGAVIVVSVGVGRVALNVHYPSDVVAGWALGFVYFAAWLSILRPVGVRATDETPATPDIGR